MAGRVSSLGRPAGPTSLAQLGIAFALLAVLAVLPPLGLGIYWQGVVITSLYLAMLALNWNLLSGYTGLFSLAPAGFAMLGAYVTALLWTYAGVGPLFGIAAGALFSALVGLIVGVLTLRLAGPYLALTTLALAEILRVIALNSFDITRGEIGLEVPALFAHQTTYYYVFMAVVAAMLLGLHWLLGRPCGLYLRAIRNDETGARARGVRTVFWKVFAFTVSSGLSGFAGALFAHYVIIVSPSIGHLLVTGLVISMVVIGGMGTVVGPLIGALLVNGGSEYLRAAGDYHHIVFPILVILFARFCREGIAGRVAVLFHARRGRIRGRREAPLAEAREAAAS